jgi:RNA polymerase sigma-70 factor
VRQTARAELIALVRAGVTPRFALSEGAFIDRVAALGIPADRLVLDDLYLAAACAAGDDAAWREVEQKHFAFIRDFAARFLTGADAEDLASAVIADLWQRGKIAQFQGRSTLRTWLGAVVTRAALNVRASARLRLTTSATGLDRAEPPAPAAPVHDDDADALARFVRSAIGRLDPEEKLLLLFHYEQGLSLDDMAPLVGASKATLSRRLTAIRDKLRLKIETMAVSEGGGRAAESLRSAIDQARAEFDLAALLGGSAEVKGGAGDRV